MKTEQLAKIPAMPANPVPRLDLDGDRRAKMHQFIDDLEEEHCFDTAEFYNDLLKDDVKLEPTTWSFLGHEQAPVIDGKKQSKQSKKQEAKQAKQAKQASKASKARSKQSKTQAKLEARKTDASNRVRAYCLRARGRGTPPRRPDAAPSRGTPPKR